MTEEITARIGALDVIVNITEHRNSALVEVRVWAASRVGDRGFVVLQTSYLVPYNHNVGFTRDWLRSHKFKVMCDIGNARRSGVD